MRPPPPVKVAAAVSKSVPYVIRNVGYIEAWNTVNILPQVSGQIVGIHFNEGQIVRPGDPLFTIDPRIYQAELGEAEGALYEAQAALEFNRERVRRFAELLPEDYVSKLDFDNYMAQVSESIGTVQQYQAAVEKGKVNVDYTTINAPIPGMAGLRNYDLGNVVTPSEIQPMVTINQLCPIYAVFTIPEKQFPLVMQYNSKEGLEVTAYTEAGTAHVGKLDYITNQIDNATGTATLRAHYPNNDLSLWPGQYCMVEVKLYEIPDAVLIPTAAIGLDTKGHYTFVVGEGDVAEIRRLQLGQQFDEWQVVTKGVKGGEQVITEGQISVAPGAKVRIVSL
ncbi:MAG: efflux RND transporter periplasmic adaptor subunit [Parachlamydiales bacterium]